MYQKQKKFEVLPTRSNRDFGGFLSGNSYKIYLSDQNKFVNSRDVDFDERVLITGENHNCDEEKDEDCSGGETLREAARRETQQTKRRIS